MSERVMQLRRGRQRDEKLMEIGLEVAMNPAISLLDQVKIEAAAILPVLEALRAELGTERADDLVFGVLREKRRKAFHRFGELMAGSPKEKWRAGMDAFLTKIGPDVDFDWLADDAEAWDFDVVGCRYAEFFRSVGEPELGAVLVCECDDHWAEVGSPEVDFARTQTIMKGASCCDFRHRMRTDEGVK